MDNSRARAAERPALAETPGGAGWTGSRVGAWLLLLAAAGIPLSLLWDYSWESTVGVDLLWSPPHTANYLTVALAGLIALVLVFTHTRAQASAVRLGWFRAPLGVWVAVWGALAFLTAVLFDRWWQSSYGLVAGIWHPPQILKACAFFAVLTGAWLFCLNWQNQSARENNSWGAAAFAGSGGLVLAMITVVTLMLVYPNRQQSATFYKVACGTYPIVLVALAKAGTLRRPATIASLVYLLVICSMLWVLPLFPAKPQVPPIYNPLDHLMPPPFPLLLIAPALVLDVLFRKTPTPLRERPWLQAVAAGLAFLIIFAGAQSLFSDFLLSSGADNWFFAGGGRHWPFFLKIDAPSRISFWKLGQDEMNVANVIIVAVLAVLAARVGLWIGTWMTRLRR